MTKKLVIIKTGETFSGIVQTLGDFEEWIARGLGMETRDIQVVQAHQNQDLPAVNSLKGVVIAGSHAMVTQDLDWSLKLEAWIPGLIQARVPLLGICYGHQLMARAMGGQVDYHPRGIEIGTTETTCAPTRDALAQDPLFHDLPGRFKIHVCHSQTVIKLPESAHLIAGNAFEPHHAFRMGECAWGVQFHPEYTTAIMKAYVEKMTRIITASGQEPALLLDRVEETPLAAQVLLRFGTLARGTRDPSKKSRTREPLPPVQGPVIRQKGDGRFGAQGIQFCPEFC